MSDDQVQVITVDLTQVLGSLEAMAAALRAIAAEVDDAIRAIESTGPTDVAPAVPSPIAMIEADLHRHPPTSTG